jgi:beta-lactamase class A
LSGHQQQRLSAVTIPDNVPWQGRGAPTTARDMAVLVRASWPDEAGPPTACAQVRESMSHQVVQRLARAFPDRADISVAAKRGRIPGLIRSDVGAICMPEGRYAAAVFACANHPFAADDTIDATLGQAAAAAIKCLQPSTG